MTNRPDSYRVPNVQVCDQPTGRQAQLKFNSSNTAKSIRIKIINLRVLTAMQYDHADRVLNITKKINDGPTVTIEEDEYDVMGQLKTKKLGRKKDEEGNYTETPLETLDYTYNIRGWLKGINKDYANGLSPLRGSRRGPLVRYGTEL